MRTISALTTAIASSMLLLSGCVVAPYPEYSSPAPYYGEAVMVAPPPLRIERPGPPPVAGYVWIGGYWNWVGGRHDWVSGRWEAPREGHRWVPHQWVQEGQHWRRSEGHWEPHRRDAQDQRREGRRD